MTQHLIDKYQLEPHPEGGFYRQIYASEQTVASPVSGQKRCAVTQIYFLLQKGQISRFHKVDHDEIWHHYEGSPLNLIQLQDDKLWQTKLGGSDGEYTGIVRGGVFQAAESTGEYSLVGCTVAPGFDFADFCFVEDPKITTTVVSQHPDFQRFL